METDNLFFFKLEAKVIYEDLNRNIFRKSEKKYLIFISIQHMCEFDTLILFKERLIIFEYDDFMQHLSIEKTRFL